MNERMDGLKWSRATLALAVTMFFSPVLLPAFGQETDVSDDTGAANDAGEVVVEKHVYTHGAPTWVYLGNRTYLGIEMMALTPELREHFGAPSDFGVMVSRVRDESPAQTAGLQVGDIVTAIDGESVVSPSSLAMDIAHRNQGETITIEVWREGRVDTLEATLEEHDRPMVDIRRFHIPPHGGEGVASFEGIEALELEDMDWNDFTVGQFDVEVDPEVLHQAMQRLNERLADPEWQARILRFNEHEHKLQEQVRALEERLQDLETELERLSDGS